MVGAGERRGAPITGYVLTPFVNGGVRDSITFGSAATTEVITGLNNGAQYQFEVAAVNAIGTGPFSTRSNGVTPMTGTPPSPTVVSAAASTASGGSVLVSWIPPTDDGGSPITGYIVKAQ